MKLNKKIESLEQSMLEEGQDDDPGWEMEASSHRDQLMSALGQRTLGPKGQRLLHWLQTGEGWNPEVEDLLRRVCARVHEEVFVEGKGFIKGQGYLDPDQIIENLPQELLEDARDMALNRFGFGIIPLPGDDQLLADILDADDMTELIARLNGKPYPYCSPPDRQLSEALPGDQ